MGGLSKNITAWGPISNRLTIKNAALASSNELLDARASGAAAPTLTVVNSDIILASLHQISQVATGTQVTEAYCSVWLNKIDTYGGKTTVKALKTVGK